MLRASERNEAQRTAWWIETQAFDPRRLVFVDESGTNLSLTPRYGRAPRGQRVVGVVPRNHGPNVTLFADGEVWPLFARQILVPSLRPGQIVIWDNLGVHKNQQVRQLIEDRGCQVRFLPPYSPDFSPIEQAFGKLKTALRQANARTRPALEDAIAAGLATITPHAAAAWFRHCGYRPSEQLL